jgi:hypothetical protein
MRRRTLSAVAVLAAFAATSIAGGASASAATLKGTVVHRNASVKSFTVALRNGRLAAVHSTTRPRPGRVVVVTARELRNGTYSASKVRTVGRTHRARFRGTVTYVHRAKRVFTVSSRGVSMAIHRRAAGTRARSASDSWPAVGSVVTVTTAIDDDGDVEEQDIKQEGKDDDGIEIEGKIVKVDEQARTLTVTSDDDDETSGTLLVHVPASFDLKQFTVGQEVELRATLQPDGSYLLLGSASDDDENEADDDNHQQGDQGEHAQVGKQEDKHGNDGPDSNDD